ncbi:hypothetical protein HK103_005336 [Boothiomyces macroporosus]|uniref:Uncharacterized protein n=1 Tax=Boothiomyces macroporosus TaxID=261099 RepID=A0AAD5UMG6_9FUNG|nr:hypothetical protein HK103_005336 [Boothiomyces macroporosus]
MPMPLPNASRHVYISGNKQITLNIEPQILIAKEPSYFNFTITSNALGNFSFKIIGTESVVNKKSQDHVFLVQEFKVEKFTNEIRVQQPISPEGFLRSVKITNASISYKVEFYFNKINICTTSLDVIIPTNVLNRLLSTFQIFANPSNLLFSIEGSRILLLHSDDDSQFLISPFRPKLVVVGTRKVTSVCYSIIEQTALRVKHRPHSWDVAMNVIKKEEKPIASVELAEIDFEYQDGTVTMPLEVLRLEDFVGPDVKGNYLTVKHLLSVDVNVDDGNKYTLRIPIQVITH